MYMFSIYIVCMCKYVWVSFVVGFKYKHVLLATKPECFYLILTNVNPFPYLF